MNNQDEVKKGAKRGNKVGLKERSSTGVSETIMKDSVKSNMRKGSWSY